MKKTLKEQWEAFVKSGFKYSKFTNDLYNSMYCRGEFIAHGNKEGFYKQRFQTINNLDLTTSMMLKVDTLKLLLTETSTIDLINARKLVAQIEIRILTQQVAIFNEKIKEIKSFYLPNALD